LLKTNWIFAMAVCYCCLDFLLLSRLTLDFWCCWRLTEFSLLLFVILLFAIAVWMLLLLSSYSEFLMFLKTCWIFAVAVWVVAFYFCCLDILLLFRLTLDFWCCWRLTEILLWLFAIAVWIFCCCPDFLWISLFRITLDFSCCWRLTEFLLWLFAIAVWIFCCCPDLLWISDVAED